MNDAERFRDALALAQRCARVSEEEAAKSIDNWLRIYRRHGHSDGLTDAAKLLAVFALTFGVVLLLN